jgi:hypothetical protein
MPIYVPVAARSRPTMSIFCICSSAFITRSAFFGSVCYWLVERDPAGSTADDRGTFVA